MVIICSFLLFITISLGIFFIISMKYFAGTTIVPAFKIVVICSSSMELGMNFSMKIFELLAIKVIPD